MQFLGWVVTAWTVVSVLAAAGQDKVTSLPGMDWEPSWNQYSGYLQASGTRHLHYWFVESANSPDTDPLVLWMNGGPGCSSLDGLLTEHGPFKVSEDSRTLSVNKYSWNNVANMLYLEAPAGVGFSYADDKHYSTDDDEVAKDNLLAMKDFFRKFPEFKSNKFFVTGESYAGIYVPTLSVKVIQESDFNFVGMAIGNGISNFDLNDDSLLYFGYYHGLIGQRLWKEMTSNCCEGEATKCPFAERAEEKTGCFEAVSEATSILQNPHLNIYNLYEKCHEPKPDGFIFKDGKLVYDHFGYSFLNRAKKQKQMKTVARLMEKAREVRLTPPCLNEANVIEYLNRPDVREALHIPTKVQAWDVCSHAVHSSYSILYLDVSELYKTVLSAGKRVLVYNGDIGMACNFLGDEWFVERLNLTVVARRKPWFYVAKDRSTQIAGYTKQFRNLTLLTVKGAGHMVPQDKPIAALDMFSNFIHAN